MTTRANFLQTLIGCLGLMLLGAANVFASTIYVNTNASGSNTGLNWANAYTDLQSALATASAGDAIWVAAGVYKPTSTTNRDIAFEIPSGVSLFGGFIGTETSLNQRDWAANATVLSGAIGSQVDITDNTRVLIRITDADNPVEVNGFKIRRAYHEITGTFSFQNSEEIIFSKCEFNLNTGDVWLFNILGANTTFNDCLFHSNTTMTLFTTGLNAEVVFNNCTVAGNTIEFVATPSQVAPEQFYNCVVWQPGASSVPLSTASHCIVSDPQWVTLGQNNVLADPLFIAPGSNNYRLQLASPAIDLASTNFVSQGFDLDRNLRIYGAEPDAGCYEARIPTRIYVDTDATGLNNGANWANAFNSLQDAIAISIPGDKIWVAEGVYRPTTGTSRSATFQLPNGVEVYGGFNGTETNRHQRNWQSNLTILSGDIGVQGDLSDNCFHVVRMSSMGEDYFLDGFVIESGNANGGSLNDEGGGITIQGANSAVVQNCWLRNNFGNDGGGVHIRSVPNNVVVQQSIFQNNQGGNGAAIYFANDPAIRSCLFVQNNAANDGIVFAEQNASLVLNNCTFYLNNLQTSGAHVIDGQGSGANWLITNSIFWFNSHPNQVAAIYNQGSNALVSHCILQNAAYTGNQSEIYVGAPLFINPLAGNFALQSTSPGINAGDNSFVIESLDAIGNERIRFGNVDIGAVEGDYSPPNVIFVDIEATGSNDGSSWANAFNDIGDALLVAQAGQSIWVAEGMYISPGQEPNSLPIWQVPDGVALLGGFDGTEWAATQAAPWEHETIISGNAGNLSEVADNVSGLLGCYDTYSGVHISGFTFEGVYRLNTFGRAAIAIFNNTNPNPDLVQVTVDNCVFRDNYSGGGPSCISLAVGNSNLGNQAQVEVNNCLFYHNTGADAVIGATVGNSCFIELNNCTFTENSIVEPNNLRQLISGFSGTTIDIHNTIFWNNDVPKEFENSAQVANCIFELNINNGVNNLQVDPRFVDPANLDFSLRPNSFAIGRGDNAFVNTTIDLVGGERVQEGTVDMGCIESPYPTFEGIIYVDIDAAGNNSGLSWQNAFNNLGDALSLAEAGDRIWVAEGTYISPGLGALSVPIWQLPDGAALIGGFSGNETDEAQAAPWLHETIISGNAGNPNINTDNTSGLLGCYDSNQGTYIYGMIFQDNYVGMLSHRAPLVVFNTTNPEADVVQTTVESCIFRNNVNVQDTPVCILLAVGNAALGNQANLDLENCLFVNNSGNGPLVEATVGNSCSITMNNCTITENVVNDPNNLLPLVTGQGGTTIDIANTIFWNNDAPRDFSSFAIVTNCIYDNSSLGGVNNLQSDPLFVDPLNGDYSLSANSPAINSGNNSFVSAAIDLGGNVRIQEDTVDRGCFESAFDLIEGCTAANACNFNALAQVDDGSCVFPGCGDVNACNFDPAAACSDLALCNYDCLPVGTIIYVDRDATGSNNGSSWTDAFTDLGDALNAAAAGDQIWMADGLYVSPGLDSGSIPIWLVPDGVSLLGGFSGIETNQTQAAPWVNETIISGNAGNPNIQTDNNSGLLGCYEATSYIYGIIFEDSYSADIFDRSAVVVFNPSDSETELVHATFESCVFRNNFTALNRPSCVLISVGNALNGDAASLQMDNCLFVNNSGSGDLVAATVSNACTLVINNCTITANNLTNPNNQLNLIGGQSGTVIDIRNTIFWDNVVTEDFIHFATVSHSIFSNNPLVGVNNLQTDPLFVDPANGNYTLSANSPALNTGSNAFVTTVSDLGGNARIQDGVVDRGCFEGVQTIEPETCLGDFDNDGLISAGDLLTVLGTFGSACGSPFCGADLTGDGVVDTSDLLSFFALFGTACN